MMRIVFLITIVCLFSCKTKTEKKAEFKATNFVYRSLSDTEKQYLGARVNGLFNALMSSRGFNGQLIVAKNGEIVYEAYRGLSNFTTGEFMTANTPVHIASVSKTFTSAAILKLYEQGKLSLQDSLQKFFPTFPYKGISIEMLLSHRSGLPNYIYFMDTAWKKDSKVTNEDVLTFMINQKPLAYAPANKVFSYCNTNYVLLALVVEQITALPFPKYMKDSLFTSLRMKNSFVFSTTDTSRYTPSYSYNKKPYLLEKFDCVYGDKNVYSTARDLLLWDNAIYQHNYLSAETLRLAFSPYSNEHPSMHNYGLGWRMWGNGKDKMIYHNGWWHGNNASFCRFVNDTVTIIALGNKYNRSTYSARQLFSIFSKDGNVAPSTDE